MDESGHGAGHAGGQGAEAGQLRVRLSLLVQEHIAVGGGRRHLPVIHREGAVLFRQVDQHKAATPQVARLGQGHGQGEAGGHRRVHGVTPLGEHPRPDAAGHGLLGDYHASAAGHWVEAVAVLDNGFVVAMADPDGQQQDEA